MTFLQAIKYYLIIMQGMVTVVTFFGKSYAIYGNIVRRLN